MSLWHPISTGDEEIRILVLEPSEAKNSQIYCTLRVVSLRDTPEYEALSYVWGVEYSPVPIILSGQKHQVTVNLSNALQALRQADMPRFLWVDALCVNQLDLSERSAQVALMGTIYRSAKGVVAWWRGRKEFSANIIAHAHDSTKHFQDYPFETFGFSDESSWWNRVWTLQEAVVNQDLKFVVETEAESFRIQHLAKYAVMLKQHLLDPGGCCREIIERGNLSDEPVLFAYNTIIDLFTRREGLASRTEMDLLELITTYKARRTSNPRDKLFGFAGLASNTPNGFIDYHRPLRECLVHCARALIEQTHGFEVLSYVTFPNKDDLTENFDSSSKRNTVSERARIDGLPSWCPDWTQRMSYFQLNSLGKYHEIRRKMSVFLEAALLTSAITFDQEVLRCRGFVCDEVEDVGQPNMLSKWCFDLRHNPRLFECNRCDRSHWGGRHNCLVCENFSLCSNCIVTAYETHPGHAFTTSVTKRRRVKPRHSPSTAQEKYRATFQRTESGYSATNCFWDELGDTTYPFTAHDTLQDAFRKALTLNSGPFFGKGSNSASHNSELFDFVSFTAFWSTIEEKRPTTIVAVREGYTENETQEMLDAVNSEDVANVQYHVRALTDRRVLIVGKKGYIGVAPEHVKRGDLICWLRGGKMPFVLRRLAKDKFEVIDSTVDCTLVGGTYIHGLMEGEALEALQRGELEEREFAIH